MANILTSSIGKKLIMSISGLFLIIFLLLHMSINLFAVLDLVSGTYGAPDGLFQKGCDFMSLPIVTVMVPRTAVAMLPVGFPSRETLTCLLLPAGSAMGPVTAVGRFPFSSLRKVTLTVRSFAA